MRRQSIFSLLNGGGAELIYGVPVDSFKPGYRVIATWPEVEDVTQNEPIEAGGIELVEKESQEGRPGAFLVFRAPEGSTELGDYEVYSCGKEVK